MGGGRQAASVEWFQNFANSSAPDWDPYGMTMFALGSFLGVSGGGSLATYSRPQSNAPDIFQPFYRSSLSASTKQTTISNVAANNAAITAAGGRVLWATMTHANSAAFMEELMAFAKEKGREMPSLSTGIQLISQPLWRTPRVRSFAQSGGNVLGLEDAAQDLVIVLAMTTWTSTASDGVVNNVMKEFIDEAQVMAREAGVGSRYIYTNYAAGWQDPMRGYGERSLAFLKEVSRKFDPGQVFQRQVPGGFKLERGVGSAKVGSAGGGVSEKDEAGWF